MRLCVFEDECAERMGPLALTRPVCDLWCGARTLLDRVCGFFGSTDVGFVVRPLLAGWCRFLHPDRPVNAAAWLRQEPVLLVNARWVPPQGRCTPPPGGPCVGLVGERLAYVCPGAVDRFGPLPGGLPGQLALWKDTLPAVQAGGWLLDSLCDVVLFSPGVLRGDADWFANSGERTRDLAGVTVLGPSELLVVRRGACVEPPAVVDTRDGPVLVDRGAHVGGFSRLCGPCYVGPATQVLGGDVASSTLGPGCRVAGRLDTSILHGFVGKGYDGFVGHSYLGEWVNLGAGTQLIALHDGGGAAPVPPGEGPPDQWPLPDVAALGDHTRTGIGTLLSGRTVAGPFAQLLPGVGLPGEVPPFCTAVGGRLQERADFSVLFRAAATALRRSGQRWGQEHADFFLALFEATATARGRAILAQDSGPHRAGGCDDPYQEIAE
jgi:hypothetical protein